MILFKVLNNDGTPFHGGTGQWDLSGAWMPRIERRKLCSSGYHLCRRDDLVEWLGPAIWVAEYRGDMMEDMDKVVVHEARLVRRLETWNERTGRLFACDCAERALTRIESPDPRSVAAIKVARRYADGVATQEELNAARDAARAPAWDAAGDAASAAARTAASAAARDAAGDAASAAAFDAARDAAWATAWDAARAPAWDAARDAAWATAWAAEKKWQTDHLMQMLELELS